MAREYLVPAWTGAAEDHDLWSGKSPDDRKRKSHMLSPNRANTDAYSDDSIAQIKAQGKTSIPLADRVLPQQRTLLKLIDQIKELEQAKRDGIYTQAEYDLLRDVLFSKKERAEYLLAKQRARKPKSAQDDAQHSPQASSPIHSEKPVQIDTNRVNKTVHSAKIDAILFITGAASLLALVKFIF